jgi:hypothetical protein
MGIAAWWEQQCFAHAVLPAILSSSDRQWRREFRAKQKVNDTKAVSCQTPVIGSQPRRRTSRLQNCLTREQFCRFRGFHLKEKAEVVSREIAVYSLDLKKRIGEAIEREISSKRQIVKMFGARDSFLYKLLRRMYYTRRQEIGT